MLYCVILYYIILYHSITFRIVSYRITYHIIYYYFIISYWLDKKFRQFSIDDVFIIASFSDPYQQEILLSILKIIVYAWRSYIPNICCLVRIYKPDQIPKSYFRLR
jgi:hypothetical protein